MANIPIRDITQTGIPTATSNIVFDDGSMKRATVADLADGVRPVASQSEAQTGTDNSKTMSSLRVKQSIASEVGVTVASKSQGDAANTALQPAAIGSTVQAYDADLAAISSLSPVNNDFLQRKSGAWTNRTPTQAKADLSLSTVATSGAYADLSGLPTLGDLAAKDQAAIADIDATGTPSSTTALFGDGTWKTPSGAGDMLKSAYDPDNVGANAFDSANQIFEQSGTGAITRDVKSKLRDIVDLRDFATTFDGVVDNTTAFNDALTYAVSIGADLRLPPGIITLTSTITVPINACVIGARMPTAWATSGVVAAPSPTDGTWIYLNHTDAGFIIDDSARSSGGGRRRFAEFGTYRNQPTPTGGTFTPNPHNWDFFLLNINDCDFDGILLLNPTQGIFVGDITGAGIVATGRVNFNRIYGQPLKYGIQVVYSYDVMRMDNIHFWPYWSLAASVFDYTVANGYAIQLGRVDNPYIDRVFTFAYYCGIRFFYAPPGTGVMGGTCGNFAIGTMQCDFGGQAIQVDVGAAGVTGTVNTLTAYGATVSSPPIVPVALSINDNSCDIRIESLKCVLGQRQMVVVGGSGNLIRINTLTSQLANQSAGSYAHFNVGAGNTVSVGSRPLVDTSGAFWAGSGTMDCAIGQSIITATTNGSGEITVTHGLGFTPSRVMVACTSVGSVLFAYETALSSTTFDVTIYTPAGSTLNNTQVTLVWTAYA